MRNLKYTKKNLFSGGDNKNKEEKNSPIIKFISLIKYKPIKDNVQEAQDQNNPNEIQNQNINNSINQINESERNIEIPMDSKYLPYQQPHEFFYKANENAKLITIYQPKSCEIHSKKNDFWCKDCNNFFCLECITSNSDHNMHIRHKVHLLEEIINKTEEDSMPSMKELRV